MDRIIDRIRVYDILLDGGPKLTYALDAYCIKYIKSGGKKPPIESVKSLADEMMKKEDPLDRTYKRERRLVFGGIEEIALINKPCAIYTLTIPLKQEYFENVKEGLTQKAKGNVELKWLDCLFGGTPLHEPTEKKTGVTNPKSEKGLYVKELEVPITVVTEQVNGVLYDNDGPFVDENGERPKQPFSIITAVGNIEFDFEVRQHYTLNIPGRVIRNLEYGWAKGMSPVLSKEVRDAGIKDIRARGGLSYHLRFNEPEVGDSAWIRPDPSCMRAKFGNYNYVADTKKNPQFNVKEISRFETSIPLCLLVRGAYTKARERTYAGIKSALSKARDGIRMGYGEQSLAKIECEFKKLESRLEGGINSGRKVMEFIECELSFTDYCKFLRIQPQQAETLRDCYTEQFLIDLHEIKREVMKEAHEKAEKAILDPSLKEQCDRLESDEKEIERLKGQVEEGKQIIGTRREKFEKIF